MAEIVNPILPGFHPDPSICRVGEDFYIANSTFEWFPGVRIHHSRDLRHWRLIGGALDRPSQLNMRGNPSSGGVWAPCLSHDGQRFYLIYTDVKTLGSPIKDNHNYLVTADDIAGPWSEPVYLNSSGFDPSLFHDDDGRKWLLNMLWDHRPGRNRFAGVLCQQYDPQAGRLVGEPVNIFSGTELGYTEGPHVYKRDGWYYLMLAEGGTGYEHAVTIARSRELLGPYELDPENPMLTSADAPEAPLQKAGHASLIDTPGGQWYLVHLTGRPVMPQKRCPLGRETAIQQARWSDDGWLRLTAGGRTPQQRVPAPDLPEHPWPGSPAREEFDNGELPEELNTLRIEPGPWLRLADRPGYLRLIGRESLGSAHTVALVARRWTSLDFTAATALEFWPGHFQAMAGLTCLYDQANWHFLHVTYDDELGRVIRLQVLDNWRFSEPAEPAPLGRAERVLLRVRVDGDRMQYGWSVDEGASYTDIGPALDATQFSDEYCQAGHFTGAFVGLACVDYRFQLAEADFDWFEYQPR